MRLFKASYKDKDGKSRKSRKWYIDFTDHLGRRHKLAGYKQHRATLHLANQIEGLVGTRSSRAELSRDQQAWIDGLNSNLLKKLIKWGLIDSQRTEGTKPLEKHLEDFKNSLIAKGNTEKHARLLYNRAKKTFEGCNAVYYKDISLSQVEKYLSDLRKDKDKKKGISAQTFNFYVQAVKQFCNFMKQDRRVNNNPLKYLKKINAKANRRYKRRALEPEEIRELLEATERAGEVFNIPGHERAMLYRLAVETGLRASELKSLTAGSFDFENNTVTVKAGYTKNRKEATLPLRKATAKIFENYLSNKLPHAKALKMPKIRNLAKMLHKDLDKARIDRKDESGRVVDFHSLRHTFASMLANSGVNPKTAQDLMRHSDINLTMSTYTHTLRGQTAKAVDGLPDLDQPSKKNQQKATGTLGKVEDLEQIYLDSYLDNSCTSYHKTMQNIANPKAEKTGDIEIGNVAKEALNRCLEQSKALNGEGGIRTPGTGFIPVRRFSKPLPSASRSPLRIEELLYIF